MSAIQLFDLNGEQRFTGTSVGGGGSQPSTRTLGPYTVNNSDGHQASVDLGANSLGIVRSLAVTFTAVNFDGGDPANGFAVDPESSQDNAAFSSSARNLALPLPGSYSGQTLPYSSPPVNGYLDRYVRIAHAWGGDQGASAAATFSVVVTYF